ncbi:MAG: hypothetical protein FJX02_12680 [Alphaproteobacteria bacterium]|nr:hypothetical protein [Alphaproteobacteria bacterium]
MAAGSSGRRHGATAWAVAYRPRTRPRVVRLGRPANDNDRAPGTAIRVGVLALALVFAILAMLEWRLY